MAILRIMELSLHQIEKVDFLNFLEVEKYFKKYNPTIVVVAAKVGGIHANKTYPSDFILNNLKIQNNIIENSWKNGVKRLYFLK